MNKRVLTIVLALVMVMAMVLVGCTPKAQPAESNAVPQESGAAEVSEGAEEQANQPALGKTYKIAFSLKTITNDAFQKAIADSVQAAVEGAGHEFSLVTAGAQTAVATQVTQVEDLLTKGIDGLVLSPMDSNAVIPIMKKAKEAGVPVVLVDSGVEAGNEDLYLSFIATDNFNCGKLAGERMAKEVGEGGKVLLVRGANGSMAGDNRADGFKAGLEGSGVEIVGEQPGDWSNDKAMQVMENMLQANEQVDGIFSCSDVMLDGILQALKDSERVGPVIISVDGSDNGKELIKNGEILGSMAQFPDKMGPLAVETLLAILDGTKTEADIPKVIDSGTMLIEGSNLE